MGFTRVTTADDIKWSNDALFQGALVLDIKLPDGYVNLYPRQITIRQTLPRPIPRRITIPIVNGQLRDNRILAGADLNPPNVRFISSWYDQEGKKIGDASAVFSVVANTDSEYEITVPELEAPAAPEN